MPRSLRPPPPTDRRSEADPEHCVGLDPPGGVQGVGLDLRGSVQGVGLRPWLVRTATELGLRGRVCNLRDGVRVEAYGTPSALAALRLRLAAADLPGLELEAVESERLTSTPPSDFTVVPSRGEAMRGGGTLPVAPDLAVCEACLAELRDVSTRRFRYPFTHCAHCGPRYTIMSQVPWGREHTAMAGFPLCDDCMREYLDPADRRFHAEAISCPRCGPQLAALAPDGSPCAREGAALALAQEVLRRGGSVAVLGLGGFQLACDAASERAVTRLRRRKRRGRKPFAVMVASLAEAGKLALLDAADRALLCAAERPIALVRRRPDAMLAAAIAPDSPMLGLLLPTTPLHALLLDDFGGPLVMTSGNASGEPIVHRVADAPARLGAASDLLLVHDRFVEAPCDDSLARCVAGAPLVLRRARGYVPRPVRLPRALRKPVLALGAHWSSCVCVAAGDRAWLSTHVGDLASPESADFLADTARHLCERLDLTPGVVAHDLHPGYESTRLARSWPGARPVAVQHHHAHLAAALTECGECGPAYALTWDGTGLGPDGAAWGGELLWGDTASAERVATLRPLRLAGGDRAIQEVWRIALALLIDAFEGEIPPAALTLLEGVGPEQSEQVRSLLAADVACPRAHGVGRLFDGIGALVLGRSEAGFQGEVAMGLEWCADPGPHEPYPWRLDRERTPWQIDWRPWVRALVADRIAGRPPAEIAARFHATLVEAGAAALRAVRSERGPAPVALSGGCFQNRLLVEGLLKALEPDWRVLRHARVPPGDGGLALGQAVVASAMLEAEEGPPPCA